MNIKQTIPKLSLFPVTADVNEKNHLKIGGCDTVALTEEFGTPLYVFDEVDIRSRCSEFKTEFENHYPDTTVCYSAKAFINKALLSIIEEEGLGLDVVSGGELAFANSVRFPMDRVFFPGNNKSAEELKLALDLGVGRIVVDNLYELHLLSKIADNRQVDILLRFTPGIDPHTHRYNATGIIDSKFGFTVSTWEEAVTTAIAFPNINLVGLHFHLGSGIYEIEPYRRAIEIILQFAATMKENSRFELKELDIGGGIGVQYTLDKEPPTISAFAEASANDIIVQCGELNLPLPRLIVEPGRAIIGQAGIALYRAGVIKDIPDVRRYVSVDGGMGDNIRYPLYGARHEAAIANNIMNKESEKVTICGKFCEPGDVLISDINLPHITADDIIALAGCGAYCIPLASNYNASFRPAIIMVRDGKSRLIRRRETIEDLMQCDML